MSIAERFGANLVRERKRAGLSQEEVSERADLHRTEIGYLERGIRLPRLDTILKLAGGLEIQPSDLLVGMVWKSAPPTSGRFEFPDDGATL
ncbi:MAG TPA: helix-turn-helix transcriptional regulator [Solirubrobacterales bacterium]|nr:helix-turn-helix transcriptional regulator [Solirubrobacterales bacterium]